ncbi:hypothetical protein [Loigolactobacillus jiayinensis]|uniref:Uncharacterized protein n=1 Tax=Loigolactobacillus jiayinensis TaxID=2486016 RepID=A0ABW1RGR1_9LACO|nr:hypothetical protein [Loigolactobacillus jiayinensis]
MADYKMTNGMNGWMAKYNQFVKDQTLEISAWTDAGISFINGYTGNTSDMPNTLKYRTITFGGVLIATEFAGYVKHPALTSGQGVVEICKLPSAIMKSAFTKNLSAIGYISTGQYTIFSLDTTDYALAVNIWGLTENLAAGGVFQVNATFEW